MMHRNLDRRVEALVSLKEQSHIDYLKDVLNLAFDQDVAAWHLSSDGTWRNCDRDASGQPLRQFQETLIKKKGLRGSA
jgi:polyphosphate kinase